jgi:hypothetical protein
MPGKDSIKYSFHISIWRLSGVRLDHAITLTEIISSFLFANCNKARAKQTAVWQAKSGELVWAQCVVQQEGSAAHVPTAGTTTPRWTWASGLVHTRRTRQQLVPRGVMEVASLTKRRRLQEMFSLLEAWKLKTSRRTRSRRLSSWTEWKSETETTLLWEAEGSC